MEYASNSKANFDYEILETIEAGLVLTGPEVKSIRASKCTLIGSYVKILSGQAWLIGATISPYQIGNMPEKYDPQQSRKLLLKKKELTVLTDTTQAHGLTLIPLKLYDKKGRIKLLVGIAKGRKKHDKRESLKKKDVARARQRGIDE